MKLNLSLIVGSGIIIVSLYFFMTEGFKSTEKTMEKKLKNIKELVSTMESKPTVKSSSSKKMIEQTITEANNPYSQGEEDFGGWWLGNEASSPDIYKKPSNDDWILPY